MGSFALCFPGVFGQKWYWLEINGGENNSKEAFTPWLSMPGPGLQWLQSSLRPQLLGASLTKRFGFSNSHNHSLMLPLQGGDSTLLF